MEFLNLVARPTFSILIILLALNIWMYLVQPSMIFYPYKALQANPDDWGMKFENITFSTDDNIQLHGWYIPREGATKTLLFFHGNAGNISHRGDSIYIFHKLGLNVFIFDYRGYGESQGKPNEQGLYLDARAAWGYLLQKKKLRTEDIILFGRSLGGSVATHLASEVSPSALILESCFSSARDTANILMPILSRLVIMRFRFDNIEHIRGIRLPLMILHSPQDDIIPYRLGKKLFEQANEPKTFYKMSGDHNTGFLQSQPGYGRALKNFLDTLPQR